MAFRTCRRSLLTLMVLIVAACSDGAGQQTPTSPGSGQSSGSSSAGAPEFAVLVFSRTEGFRHDSISAGITAIRQQAGKLRFTVDATEDSQAFSDENLDKYATVVFLSTTGDVLNPSQQGAFERFIRKGRGFVGVHSAADTEYDWPFYGGLIGAYFAGHPDIQQATVRVEATQNPVMQGVPSTWPRRDEWYNFQKNPRDSVTVLATLDERTYSGGTMGADHPIAWSRNYEGGRSVYTAGGHTSESFSEPLFADHLGRAIVWAARGQ